MTYNDIYVRTALLNDMRGMKLGKKALTEVVLLRVHYNKGLREFEAAKQDVLADESADEETRKEALEAKAAEDCPAVDERKLTAEAFEEIVEAAAAEADGVETFMATDAEGKRLKVPAEVWLEQLAAMMVNA